jgi:hypothetical protein
MKELLELSLEDIKIAINYWLRSTREQEIVEIAWNLSDGAGLTLEVKPITKYYDER